MQKRILTIALTCAIAHIALAASSQSLLSHATKIKHDTDHFTGGSLRQYWASDTQLLYFSHGGGLKKYDIQTRKDIPLRKLTRLVEGNNQEYADINLSPNGKLVLWSHSLLGPFFAATLNGSHRYQWHANTDVIRSNYEAREFWCADSKHWIMLHSYAKKPNVTNWFKAQIYATPNASASNITLQVPTGLSKLQILSIQSDKRVIARIPEQVHTMTPDEIPEAIKPKSFGNIRNYAIYRGWSWKLSKQQTISVWDLHSKTPLHTWTITLPGLMEECAVSPHADRITWICSVYSKESKLSTQSLWTSRLDGSQLTIIGDLPAIDNNTGTNNHISQLMWLPSGTQISFLYHRALWTVPASK